MHSRIIELSKDTNFKNYTESEVFNMINDRGVDYVREVGYNDDDADWLLNTNGTTFNPKTKTVRIISREKYFEPMWEDYKKDLREFLGDNIQNFNEFIEPHGKFGTRLHFLNWSYDDDIGCKIIYGDAVYNRDYFIRNKVENGDVFYIGEIYDYHF